MGPSGACGCSDGKTRVHRRRQRSANFAKASVAETKRKNEPRLGSVRIAYPPGDLKT